MSSLGSVNASHTNMTDIIINQKPHQSHNQMIEDPRTLQLALELSLVGLNDNQQQQNNNGSYTQTHPMSTQSDYEMGSAHNTIVTAVYGRADMSISNLPTLTALPSTTTASGLLMPSSNLEDRTKKSQNMTECVPVPSSEHVAEIVGRQGCKIKALRAKTNTYIKTPVRGEEPVFVVTGRKEDVNKAKREILSAADHFSLIRASRKPSVDGSNAMFSGTSINPATLGGIVARTQSGPPCLPGQITIQVRVPYRVVGLVVGPKGATIKHIQQETQTYIVTPSREKEPIFEVTGLPDNVETARKQIEAHIALRTGNSGQSSENGTESIASTKSTNNSVNTPPELVNIWKNLNDSIDIDEGIGDSPSIWNLPPTTTAVNITTHISASNCSPTASISPTDSLLGEHKDVPKIMNKLHNPEEIQPLNQLQQLQLRTTTTTAADKLHAMHRECCVCNEREVTTALVPCGHNMFCMDCANQICVSLESLCPICHSIVYHAMRIIA